MRACMLFLTGLLVGVGLHTVAAQGPNNTPNKGLVQVNHIGMNVPNLDEAVTFYTKTMGFPEAFRVNDEKGQARLVYVQISKNTFFEIQPGPGRPAAINHVGIHVENMRFAADYPRRTRTLVVVGGPAKPLAIANPSPIPQRDRLGSNAPREMVDYWNTLFSKPDREGVKGLGEALSKFDLAKEGVLQRISAPTLVITADRSKMHSVEEARAYQVQIPNSRLVVIRSDAYHIAAANADECLGHTLAFLKEQKQGH